MDAHFHVAGEHGQPQGPRVPPAVHRLLPAHVLLDAGAFQIFIEFTIH